MTTACLFPDAPTPKAAKPVVVTTAHRFEMRVFGEAMPAGSKVTKVIYGRGGKPVFTNGRVLTVTLDSSDMKTQTMPANRGKKWRETIQRTARAHNPVVMTGPIRATLTFYRSRNDGDFGTGRNAGIVKPSAKLLPDVKPDGDKLARALFDALKGICFLDDGQVTTQEVRKRFGRPGVHVVIEADESIGDDEHA